jgi:GNAT superfamily N-acetyltransferase
VVAQPEVKVRDCTEDDLPALVRMWREMRRLTFRLARGAPAPTLENAAELLELARRDPAHRLVVALVEGRPAGMACFSRQPVAPLAQVDCVQVTYLHVFSGFCRQGVGHALVAEAAGFADSVGAEHVVVSVLPGLREPNRFFARLGFGPVVVNRAASVASLRRRLVAQAPGPAAMAERLAQTRPARRRPRHPPGGSTRRSSRSGEGGVGRGA